MSSFIEDKRGKHNMSIKHLQPERRSTEKKRVKLVLSVDRGLKGGSI